MAKKMKEQIESGDLDLEAFHNKEHSSSVRKLTIECLQTLLLYRPLTSLVDFFSTNYFQLF